MNFLAHVYLSGENKEVMVGNFIGDFVKGNQMNLFDLQVRAGIILHRSIDAYTDSHPVVTKSKSRLRKKYRHYAGVIVDVFYDHFLAANWKDYHHTELVDYTHQTYSILLDHGDILPQRVHYMLGYMMEQNWLLSYSEIDGIGKALSGLSRRTRFNSKMNESVIDLEAYYDEFESEFREFFEDLRVHSENTLSELLK